MQFINPLEILELSTHYDTKSIDGDVIKKAKRKLFADIDLSDEGYFHYHHLNITKSDCEKAIDGINSEDVKEYYWYLANNPPLNEFLINGDVAVFNNFRQDSIFKLPDFVKFISPYYSFQFDKALLNAFDTENETLARAILKTSYLINTVDINSSFKSVSNKIQSHLDDMEGVIQQINAGQFVPESQIDIAIDIVKGLFPTKIINCLPAYFQSQILKIAKSINYLQLAIWKKYDTTQVSNDLLEYLLTLNIDGLEKPTFLNNYEIVKKRNNERIEYRQNQPVLKKYADFITQIQQHYDNIKNKTLTPNSVSIWVNNNLVVTDLNNLSSTFDEVKNQVALSLRALSVQVYNTYSNLTVAIQLINKASSISGLTPETKENLTDATKQLNKLKAAIDLKTVMQPTSRVQTPTSTPPPPQKTISARQRTAQNNADTYNVLGWIFGIVILIVVIATCNASKDSTSSSTTPSEYTSPSSPSNNTPSTPEYPSSGTTSNSTPIHTQPVESEYKGNQLRNGASPLNGCFGKGTFAGRANINFINGNYTDAIVCLVNTENGKTIRNEYIRGNSEYKMSSIPSGTYYLKIYYGSDWNPKMENFCGTNGAFESNVHFTKVDGYGDQINITDDEYSYTSGSITLNAVANGNMKTEDTNAQDFFNK